MIFLSSFNATDFEKPEILRTAKINQLNGIWKAF